MTRFYRFSGKKKNGEPRAALESNSARDRAGPGAGKLIRMTAPSGRSAPSSSDAGHTLLEMELTRGFTAFFLCSRGHDPQ